MSESIYKNNELENEVILDMSYFWYSDGGFKFSIVKTESIQYGIMTVVISSLRTLVRTK
jgi:hypothetical protein